MNKIGRHLCAKITISAIAITAIILPFSNCAGGVRPADSTRSPRSGYDAQDTVYGPSKKKERPMYTMVDGSGNVYHFEGEMLVYNPVKPAESSSGVYDGGEAFTRELSSDEAAALTSLLEKCLTEAPSTSGARPMGSWLVKREDGTGTSLAVIDSSTGLIAKVINRIIKTE